MLYLIYYTVYTYRYMYVSDILDLYHSIHFLSVQSLQTKWNIYGNLWKNFEHSKIIYLKYLKDK